MRTRFLLSVLLILLSITGFSKTWTVTNNGSMFKPADITINQGDTVVFTLSSSHNVVEVSKATYDANNNTPLPGFELPYGGGTLLPSQLTTGTHYYVCTPHATWGMKGTIIVKGTTSKTDIAAKPSLSVDKANSSGIYSFTINNFKPFNSNKAEVFNLAGIKISQIKITDQHFNIDLSNRIKGIYIVKVSNKEGFLATRIHKE